MNQNWTGELTTKEQEQWYQEVVNYFTDDVNQEVFEKYDNSLDFHKQNV
jgi:hypothetical protein